MDALEGLLNQDILSMDIATRGVQRPAISSDKVWITRGLMTLMLLLTLFSGISINGDFSFLFANEITSQVPRLLKGRMTPIQLFIWSPIIISHAFIFSLIFLVRHRYFYRILIWAPIVYILFFTIYGLFVIFGLIPFIIIWLVSLGLCRDLRYKRVKTG